MPPHIILIRYKEHSKITTYADLQLYIDGQHRFFCKAQELAWNNNTAQISRIPAGKYVMKLEYSPAFKRNLYELKGVPGRSEIKIHVANYYKQLKGCIALGTGIKDINADTVPDTVESTKAFDAFMSHMADAPQATIHIIDAM